LKRFIQKLADRELYVGEFYVRTAQYNACVIRLEDMLKKVREVLDGERDEIPLGD
jgi:outer membrane protein assembly factor BamD (BamD/ComL family)